MKKLNKKGLVLSSSKGFTLIEVVLVLAIGGLIFLLAFIAFQQVSANRRDTQRRSDAGRVIAELQNYYGDKQQFPVNSVADANVCVAPTASGNTFKDFTSRYMCQGNEFKSPNGAYEAVAATPTPALDKVAYYKDRKCGDVTTVANGAVSVYIGLEKGVVCREVATN